MKARNALVVAATVAIVLLSAAASAADSPVSPVLPAKNTSAETGLWLGAAARAA